MSHIQTTSAPLRAIIVCVDYSDYLSLTLPYNRHHFSEVMIVTSPTDTKTQELAAANNCRVHITDAFYADGAVFNKFRAMEEAFGVYGRYGWLCIMDADVLWPKHIDWVFVEPYKQLRLPEHIATRYWMMPGVLHTPLRRMWEDVTPYVPQEPYWAQFPLHPQQVEWAGYTQIFHATDSVLGPAPWHEINWSHAGAPDSWFQQKWEQRNKRRPPFICLHLGQAGRNWCGRATPYIDGSIDPNADMRTRQLRHFMRMRQATRGFEHEKL